MSRKTGCATGTLQVFPCLIYKSSWLNCAVIVRLLCGYCPVIVRLLSGYCAVWSRYSQRDFRYQDTRIPRYQDTG